MRTHWLAFIISGLLVSAARGQQCTTQVAVNAFSAQTRDVLYGLSRSDFEAKTGHSLLEVAAVKPVFRNRVLVLVDVGNSTDRQSLATISELVNEAPPDMPLAFGIFARQSAFTSGFIRDPEALGPELQRVMALANSRGNQSRTGMALHQALEMFGAHRPGDTILLVTSGNAREGNSTMARLRREFRETGTRLQLLMGLSPALASRGAEASQMFAGWSAAERFSDDLIRLANSTGGALMGFMNSDWLHAASSGYMLSITVPDSIRKPRNWSLRVRDAGNDVPRAKLFYPEQLSPCRTPMVASVSAKTKPRP